MGIIVIFMLQLWNSSSVRLIGLGRYFEGFISDPVTDLNLNPAAIKNSDGNCVSTYNTLNLYLSGQRINDIDSVLYPDTRKSWSLQKTEPFSFFIFHPKIGIGFRTGAFVRRDRRNNCNIEQWYYGQNGFYGALQINKYLKVGGEFNWSWNNQTDRYEVTVWDTIYNEYDVGLFHKEFSKELGGGCIIGNGNWEISASAHKNWEKNTYTGSVFWPDDWQSEWDNPYNDLYSYIKLRYSLRNIHIIFKYNYSEQKQIHRLYYQPQDSSVLTFCSFKPGVAILYQTYEDLYLIGSFMHDYHKYEEYYMRSLIVPIGFEKKLNKVLTLRFGTNFMYVHKDTYDWIAIFPSIEESYLTNTINFGFDYKPYKKLFLYFASEDLLNIKAWFFGLHFML